MAAKTEEEFLKREKPVKLVVGVAVDGSTLSDRALATACSCVQEQRGDRLVLLHVADSAKTYLPRHLQPRHLENTYTSKAFDLRVSRAEWACVDKGSSSTCEALMQLAQTKGIQLLVVGSFGRTGEKIDMLGTVSDFSLRAGQASVAIVRCTAPARQPGQPQTYMFATDGSRAAALAFCVTCHQLVRPGDRLLLASCSYEHTAAPEDFDVSEYLVFAARLKIACELVLWRLERSQTVADGLLELARLREVDTLVCGTTGYSQKQLGSVSDEITHRASMNTIVIKDPHQVLANEAATAGALGLSGLILPQAQHSKELSRVSRGLDMSSDGGSASVAGGIKACHHARSGAHV